MNWKEAQPVTFGGYQSRVFQALVDDGHLSVFIGQEPLGPKGEMRWHLSMSHRSNVIVNTKGAPAPGRLPNWEEIKEARYKFLPNSVTMGILLPPIEEYVNLHPTTMHLHEVVE